MTNSPNILVKWESPARAFFTSVRPAFSRVHGHQLAYVRSGISIRGPLISIVGHFALFWSLVALTPTEVKRPAELVLLPIENGPDTIVYWSAGLPETADRAGAETGRDGKAGGGQFFSPQEIIRISRGNNLNHATVDAPRLKLKSDVKAVANLLILARTNSPVLEAPKSQDEPAVRDLQSLARDFPIRKPRPVSSNPSVQPVTPPSSPDLGMRPQESTLALALLPESGSAPPLLAQVVSAPDFSAKANLDEGPGVSGSESLAVVLSATPGTSVGVPSDVSAGSFASSSSGRSGGLSGQGNGGGIATGQGPGSGNGGTGPGASVSGVAHGSDLNARGGTSLGPGPGGAGDKEGRGRIQIPGLSIRGGVVNIPSFSSTSGNTRPDRSPSDRRNAQSVVIVATSRAGGALPAYGFLKGGRVYTIYINTPNGIAVLQFADPSARQGFEAELTPPEPLRTDIDTSAPLPRTVVSCGIDRTGMLKDLRVVEAVAPGIVPQLLSALRNWRFRPALRGDEAVEVTAILGFAVNTR